MDAKRKHCPHCDEELVTKVYKRHRRQYFNEISNSWTTVADIKQGDDEPLDVGDVLRDITTNDGGQSNTICDFLGLCTEENSEKYTQQENIKAFMETLEEEDQAYFCEPSVEEESNQCNFEIWDTINENELNEDFIEQLDSSNLYASVFAEESHDPKLLALANWFCLFLSYLWYFHNLTETCMLLILGFFRMMFLFIGQLFPCMAAFSVLLPMSLYKLKKMLGFNEDTFTKFVVCQKCSSIYKFDDCYKRVGSQNIPVNCKYREFPAHRQKRHRQPCGVPLLKEVEVKGNKKRLYPFKVYCFKSVLHSLSHLVKRDGFAEKCEMWRERRPSPGVMSDVYDGRIWREFHSVQGKPFLSAPKNYAMQLNLDWFCPFKHLPYSVGALYLIILNLPRAERYKKENVILVGLIPGPREPTLNINPFLGPLIDELKLLWDEGLACSITESGKQIVCKFHAALINIVSDVPATRKLCGFVGHMAKKGCSKCEKEFITGNFGEKINYGGFEPANRRHNARHRNQAIETDEQTSKTDRDSLVSEYGVRYTSLIQLTYFDCVRFHVIDPLHNLFLGTGKHIMKNVWLNKEKPKISKSQLETIQQKIDCAKVPSEMGRMPLKIATNFGGFTADQWKHWIILFSVFSLKGILPAKDMEMWRFFVLACRLLCSPVVTLSNIAKSHSYLMQFCRQFEKLYGSEKVTPNMHYHTHLVDCILDYGPVYSFWTFPYERYNGILSDYCANHRSIEIQIMRKFVNEQLLNYMPRPADYQDFNEFFPLSCQGNPFSNLRIQRGSDNEDAMTQLRKMSLGSTDFDVSIALKTMHLFSMVGPVCMDFLEPSWVNNLREMYRVVLGESVLQTVSGYIKKCVAVKVAENVLGSEDSRYRRSSYVLARWCTLGGKIDFDNGPLRPGIVEYYFSQCLTFDGKPEVFISAKVQWFQQHNKKKYYGEPVEVWCKNAFEMSGPASFIPVQRIQSKFIAGFDTINREKVMCVIPYPVKLYM